mgnify:CR=1 FL=1
MGFFEKIKAGLTRTKENIGHSFDQLFAGELNDDFYDELEETLILGDMGVETTLKAVEALRCRVKAEKIKEMGAARACLRQILTEMLQVGEASLKLDTAPSVVLFIGVNGVGKTTTIGKLSARLKGEGKRVLMAAAEMGYLGHYNKNKVSPFERFEVGGDGMSGYNMYGIDIIAVRGYEEGALDPSNNYSVAYNKYTMELRYPVILKPSSQIYVLGFLEGANAFDSWKQFSPFKIKRAAGFGVRLYLPVVGMLGIDWGYGFDAPANQTGKSGSQIHFMMGQQF